MSTERQPLIHNLKCESEYFDAIKSGRKTFVLSLDNHDYMAGDILRLHRSRNGAFGRDAEVYRVRVTYILREFKGLCPGFCVMAIIKEQEQGNG